VKLPDWQLDLIRRVGQQMSRFPEKFSGNVQINSVEGGVTTLTINISVRPQNGNGDEAR